MDDFQASCLTYFYVMYGKNFNLRDFCGQLGLPYEETAEFDDEEGGLTVGWNSEFDIDINVMVRKSLGGLLHKTKELVALKEKYGLEYYLERVPTLIGETEKPRQILSLAADIVQFLAETGTVDDLDYYIV